ncbi:hypothetical protein NUU61_003041 [Penicillium alfredii]|uniref:Uncharacterized protein n=1 Tax=Penicillium alfredii TaxID=1506179 RepID=A0A9W9FSU4_9EURO|nr:uncharacterized protein NUU61_003041 [Penicillium alfredii]KAJ5105694.1 hypothetical protein NUU61_003041 [Penicillium alfredii]
MAAPANEIDCYLNPSGDLTLVMSLEDDKDDAADSAVPGQKPKHLLALDLWSLGFVTSILKPFSFSPHCRLSELPTKVSLDTLCGITIFADYIQCFKDLKLMFSDWLKVKVDPSTDCIDLHELDRCIWLAWIFRRQKAFCYDTVLAKRLSTGPIID